MSISDELRAGIEAWHVRCAKAGLADGQTITATTHAEKPRRVTGILSGLDSVQPVVTTPDGRRWAVRLDGFDE